MIASPSARGRYPRSNRLPHTLRLRMSNERAAANVSKLRSVVPAVMGEVPQRWGNSPSQIMWLLQKYESALGYSQYRER